MIKYGIFIRNLFTHIRVLIFLFTKRIETVNQSVRSSIFLRLDWIELRHPRRRIRAPFKDKAYWDLI